MVAMLVVLRQELLECVDGRTVVVDNTAKGKGRQDSVEALLSLAASAAALDASASWLPPTAEHPQVCLFHVFESLLRLAP